MTVRVEVAAFDPGGETNAFIARAAGAGAVVTFTGLVRSLPGELVSTLTLDCYPELAVKQLERIAEQAIARFALLDAGLIHRYGALAAGEPIVQVMTLAAHRQAAFEAAEYLMDYLKTDAPFWKKELSADGTEHWVDAKAEDDAARARWE